MIYIKSQKEIELITKSCKILASVKKVLKDAVRPGISLKDLDSIAYNEIIKAGAKPSFLGYHGFQGTICASVNEELIHGIPSSRILKDQDLLSIDVGLIYEGYHSAARQGKARLFRPPLDFPQRCRPHQGRSPARRYRAHHRLQRPLSGHGGLQPRLSDRPSHSQPQR